MADVDNIIRLTVRSFDDPVEHAVSVLLQSLGLDVDCEHLYDTPRRVAQFYRNWLAKGEENFRFTTFEARPDHEMVMTGGIRFFSMCSHHLVPFLGYAYIAYIPNERLAGLSKLARTVQMFAHRPQVQERLTTQINAYLTEKLEPRGVATLLAAEHLCMSMRGAQVPGHITITESLAGDLRREPHVTRFRQFVQIARKDIDR
jgi:GTP cyclohydrolase I